MLNVVPSLVNMFQEFYPRFNGQTERMNKVMEIALHYIPPQIPASCTKQWLWVEYVHNKLSCSATGLSPSKVLMAISPLCLQGWSLQLNFAGHKTVEFLSAQAHH